jgi:SNF2 family DNA or RNA helicase
MNVTAYHAKYYAYDLTRRAATGLDRLSISLFDAAVDLNPHQIEAALFALESPLSKGVLLADEVGLGKTIEAGIVLCQLWAELVLINAGFARLTTYNLVRALQKDIDDDADAAQVLNVPSVCPLFRHR